MTNELTLSILHHTGDTLSNPTHRTTGTLAENSKGFPVNPWDPEACKWCLTGALGKALHEFKVENPGDQIAAYQAMKDVIGLEKEVTAPTFWDSNESLHGIIASRLQRAK